MLIKLIAKAAVTGVVVYAVAETLNRLKVAQRTIDGVQQIGDAIAAFAVPSDAQ